MIRVYFIGDETPIWITEPADLFVGRVEASRPEEMIAVNAIAWAPEDEDGEEHPYLEHTAYVRADQVAFVAPLWPKIREQIEEAKWAS